VVLYNQPRPERSATDNRLTLSGGQSASQSPERSARDILEELAEISQQAYKLKDEIARTDREVYTMFSTLSTSRGSNSRQGQTGSSGHSSTGVSG